MDKIIINAAITGAVLDKREYPDLPVTPAEIEQCAREVVAAGASIVHLHARRPDGKPSYAAGDYVEIVERVRSACPEVVVCVSLSGRFEGDVELRSAPLQSRPDMASLSLGSMNFATQPSVNSPQTIVELARRIRQAGAIPELEVFEAGFINYAKYLIKKGVLQPPYYFNLILGSLGTAPLDLVGLGYMISLLPPGALWSVGGLGSYQLPANALAIAAGGHLRVGLEDNAFYDAARLTKATNPRLVERAVRLAREMGREPASGAEVRQLLGLPVPLRVG